VAYEGLVFPTPRLYPHELYRKDVVIGNQHCPTYSGQRNGRFRRLLAREVSGLEKAAAGHQNPEDAYFTAMRFNELALRGWLEWGKADGLMTRLFQDGIDEKSFGPSYFELARQHAFMGRDWAAVEAANRGYVDGGYGPCLELETYLRGNISFDGGRVGLT
jgi:hypothetical protein